MQGPSERPSSGRVRLGDARLLERVHELEVELSEMDACADELEAEIEELHGEKQSFQGRVQHLEVLCCALSLRACPFMSSQIGRGFSLVPLRGGAPLRSGNWCISTQRGSFARSCRLFSRLSAPWVFRQALATCRAHRCTILCIAGLLSTNVIRRRRDSCCTINNMHLHACLF